MAGMIFDVFLNDDFDLACELIDFADAAGLDGPWDVLFGAFVLGEELRRRLGNDATDQAIRTLVRKLFGE